VSVCSNISAGSSYATAVHAQQSRSKKELSHKQESPVFSQGIKAIKDILSKPVMENLGHTI